MSALYLQKVLTTLVMPLGLVTTVLALVLVRRLWGARRGETWLLAAAVAILVLSAQPWVAVALIGGLEARHPQLAIAAAPVSDVIIVLGGTAEPASAPRALPQLSEGGNRLTYAARLFAAGKAREILVSGGRFDWATGEPPEAETMAEVLTWLGVPRSAIVLETRSRTTGENAARTADIWRERGWRSGLLVTSGFHMPRAQRAFACAGLTLVPASADVRVSTHVALHRLGWLPDAAMLGWTSLAIKEYLGLAVAMTTACPARTATGADQRLDPRSTQL